MRRRIRRITAALGVMACCAFPGPSSSAAAARETLNPTAASGVPGTLPAAAPRLAKTPTLEPSNESGTSIKPFYSASGAVSLSTAGAGSNSGPVTRTINKPRGGAVRAAFLLAAGTGNSGYTPHDGDVTIDDVPVDFDESSAISNSISSGNIRADVTSIVAPIVRRADAGPVEVTIGEGANTNSIDGEVLAVVFDDPTAGKDNSVALLYGAQQTAGDTFNVLLSQPVNLRSPGFGLDLALGISYGFQPSSQFSQVDVNGQRLTTSAGGQDDGEAVNGALITVGGVGDSTDNPPDPQATGCASTPRCDDELYSLTPFVHNGDTRIAVNTLNPSNDDNIFFSSLEFHGTSAVVGEGIVLSPPTDTQPVGGSHIATATVQDSEGSPVAGKSVLFTVTDGPNAGRTGTAVTDDDGTAVFGYSSEVAGTDTIIASFLDSSDETQTSNATTVTWTANGNLPPVAGLDDYSVPQGGVLTVPASTGVLANDSDPDGDPLSVSVGTRPSDGGLVLNSDGSFVYTPDATFSGTDTFTYFLSDGINAPVEQTVTIHVVSVIQRIIGIPDHFTTPANATLAVNAPGVLGNDIDPDGRARASLSPRSGPDHGELALNRDGSFSYTPDEGFVGVDRFSYDSGAARPTLVTIAVTEGDDNAPNANADSYVTDEDTALNVAPSGVLSNDADPDLDSLFAVLSSGPAHGSLTLDSNGGFSYVPAPDFTGVDSFTYQAIAGARNSVTVPVTITVRPTDDPPLARPDHASTPRDVPLRVGAPGVLGNDADRDSSVLRAILVDGPSNGTLVLRGDGSFVYTPRRGFTGLDSFSYVATDELLRSGIATVTITVTFRRPSNPRPPTTPPPSTPPPSTPPPSIPPPSIPPPSTAPPPVSPTTPPNSPVPTGEPTTTGQPSAPATTTPSATPSTPFPSTSTPASPPSSSPNVITRVPNGLTLSSPSINPGGTASASGSGCEAGAAVTLTIEGSSAGSGTADNEGNFAVPISAPRLAIGKYTVVATCGDRQLSAPVAFVSITGNSAAPAARALTVGSVLAFFLLFLGLALRRPGVGK